jgi:hypothetical protein
MSAGAEDEQPDILHLMSPAVQYVFATAHIQNPCRQQRKLVCEVQVSCFKEIHAAFCQSQAAETEAMEHRVPGVY